MRGSYHKSTHYDNPFHGLNPLIPLSKRSNSPVIHFPLGNSHRTDKRERKTIIDPAIIRAGIRGTRKEHKSDDAFFPSTLGFLPRASRSWSLKVVVVVVIFLVGGDTFQIGGTKERHKLDVQSGNANWKYQKV
jgi:hypothetical protein